MINPLIASVALIYKPVNCTNKLTGFYMRATLALNGLILLIVFISQFSRDVARFIARLRNIIILIKNVTIQQVPRIHLYILIDKALAI